MRPEMSEKRFSVIIILIFLIPIIGHLLVFPCKCSGDIYKFTDKNGVVYYTNVPTTPGGKLVIREKRFDPRSIKYERLISKISKKHMVDDALVKAIIRVESNFDTKAVSKAGAIGLMQLMPKTAEEMRVKDPFNPKENIEGGVRYLKYLLNRFKDDLTLSIAAYHAGAGAVTKYNGVPPFDSTQKYVKAVLKHLKRYKKTPL